MSDYDLVIKGGTVITSSDTVQCDVAIRGEKIAALGLDLEAGHVVDAAGLLVLPGGVDSHCHIEQLEPDGSELMGWMPPSAGIGMMPT